MASLNPVSYLRGTVECYSESFLTKHFYILRLVRAILSFEACEMLLSHCYLFEACEAQFCYLNLSLLLPANGFFLSLPPQFKAPHVSPHIFIPRQRDTELVA